MPVYKSWQFPNVPDQVKDLLLSDESVVIVGVIGKSAFTDSNKMVALGVLDRHPSLIDHEANEGQIQFYHCPGEAILFVHFETTFDVFCMEKFWNKSVEENSHEHFLLFNKEVRSHFAKTLLFATQVCHIIVFVELSVTFDASLLSIFKAIKVTREKHVLKFLPKFTKNIAGLGKCGRMCSPRFLFLFENYPDNYGKREESISKLEFEIEDNIYKMLRTEFIIMNNSSSSLFSIPGNKRFVYYNTNSKLREDPLSKSYDYLKALIERSCTKYQADDDFEELMPFQGFGKPLSHCNLQASFHSNTNTFSMPKNCESRDFMTLLKDHVYEALSTGFDDGLTKYKGRGHFVVPKICSWYDFFKIQHKILLEGSKNSGFEASDPEYSSFLENLRKTFDIDEEFFADCCDFGMQQAYVSYDNPNLNHYSSTVHKTLVDEALLVYEKYARGPHTKDNEKILREMCDLCWQKDKQQCELLSLRRNPCILPKHKPQDLNEHSSGHIFLSACNCGHTQSRRDDPFTLRQANWEFYESSATNCTLCVKVKHIHFPVFEPSINDYRAAEFEKSFPCYLSENNTRRLCTMEEGKGSIQSQPLSSTRDTRTNLSLESVNNLNKIKACLNECKAGTDSSDDSLNEFVVQLKRKEHSSNNDIEKDQSILRQPSTTEYLPGMMHTQSPSGLLPLFPSWSLVCVGPSSVYSHNTGLLEHFQNGFLPGSNFLLPWSVHVRLEHSSWTAAYEKSRYRKMGEVFELKIFVGYEYECPCGHRFMMSAPDKILRGGSDIMRDSGSKVVFNNMPLYFPCPCLSKHSSGAQLMRIHVVTPKAPVNVLLDPKIRTGEQDYIFIPGSTEPPKLSQSSYWILRLPYIYAGDEGHIAPPIELTHNNAINYGCLLAGMFGVEVED